MCLHLSLCAVALLSAVHELLSLSLSLWLGVWCLGGVRAVQRLKYTDTTHKLH
jgi:hypothetical protein